MPEYKIDHGAFLIGGDGELKDTGYRSIDQASGSGKTLTRTVGAELKIAFRATSAPAPPGGPVTRVSLVQIVKDTISITSSDGRATTQQNAGFQLAQVADQSADAGTRVDQDFFDPRSGEVVNLDPRYAQRRTSEKEKLVTRNPKQSDIRRTPSIDGDRYHGTASSGYAGERLTGPTFSLAMLRDQPTVTLRAQDSATGAMAFEIAVLFEKAGATPAQWGGSISWGFDLIGGRPTLHDIEVVSPAGLSARFGKAIAAWNSTTITDRAGTSYDLLPLPLPPS